MGLIKRFVRLSTVGGAASVGAFFWATRNETFVPLAPSDHIFHSTFFHSLNPSKNPTTHDLCIRRVPLSDINPALLEKKGKLVEAFCAGVWSGWGGFHMSRFMLRWSSTDMTIDRICLPARLLGSQVPGARNGTATLVPLRPAVLLL